MFQLCDICSHLAFDVRKQTLSVSINSSSAYCSPLDPVQDLTSHLQATAIYDYFMKSRCHGNRAFACFMQQVCLHLLCSKTTSASSSRSLFRGICVNCMCKYSCINAYARVNVESLTRWGPLTLLHVALLRVCRLQLRVTLGYLHFSCLGVDTLDEPALHSSTTGRRALRRFERKFNVRDRNTTGNRTRVRFKPPSTQTLNEILHL